MKDGILEELNELYKEESNKVLLFDDNSQYQAGIVKGLDMAISLIEDIADYYHD